MYRTIITVIVVASAALVIMPGVDLFQIMMSAQVINGVLLPILLVFLVFIAGDKAHHGPLQEQSPVGRAHLGDYRRDYSAHGRHVCAASDGLQRLTPTFSFRTGRSDGLRPVFVCYRVLVI